MRYRLLVVDNEPETVKFHWAALEEAGMQLERCQTVSEAIAKHDLYYFDLLLLDVMMDDDNVNPTGLGVYRHIRDEFEIKALPIILLTNYPASPKVRDYDQRDERLRVVNKARMLPSELVPAVKEFLDQFVDSAADEYEYFALDAADQRPVAMTFADVEPGDAELLLAQWSKYHYHIRHQSFLETFAEWIKMESHRRAVRKLLRSSNGDASIEGMIFLGGDSRFWQRDTVFESAPWNRRDTQSDRKLKHVGKVLLARFVRESIGRGTRGRPAVYLDQGIGNPSDELFKLHVGNAQAFFTSMGFKKFSDESLVHYLPHESAMEVLEHVTTGVPAAVGATDVTAQNSPNRRHLDEQLAAVYSYLFTTERSDVEIESELSGMSAEEIVSKYARQIGAG